MSARWQQILACAAIAARWVMGLIFIGASLSKIAHPHDFAVAVFRYDLAPYAAINLLAIFMPWLEMTTGIVLLAWPRMRAAAATIMIGMLTMFTAAIIISMIRGLDVACGCFSVDSAVGHISWLSLLRNTTFILLSALAFWHAWTASARTCSSIGQSS